MLTYTRIYTYIIGYFWYSCYSSYYLLFLPFLVSRDILGILGYSLYFRLFFFFFCYSWSCWLFLAILVLLLILGILCISSIFLVVSFWRRIRELTKLYVSFLKLYRLRLQRFLTDIVTHIWSRRGIIHGQNKGLEWNESDFDRFG